MQGAPGAVLAADAIRADLRSRLASDKIPRRTEIVAMLPREDTGVIFKRKLRDPDWADTGRRIGVPPRPTPTQEPVH